MTWLEWIEQRTDEDVQRDDEEADNIRRRMEEENGISPEGYDDDNFEDNEDLKNVVVGLGPLGPGDGCFEARRVFALPSIASEKVLAIRLLPSCEKGQGDNTVTPALILLTEDNSCPDKDASSARLLKVPPRCDLT